jgi:hypothetical protein
VEKPHVVSYCDVDMCYFLAESCRICVEVIGFCQKMLLVSSCSSGLVIMLTNSYRDVFRFTRPLLMLFPTYCDVLGLRH